MTKVIAWHLHLLQLKMPNHQQGFGLTVWILYSNRVPALIFLVVIRAVLIVAMVVTIVVVAMVAIVVVIVAFVYARVPTAFVVIALNCFAVVVPVISKFILNHTI